MCLRRLMQVRLGELETWMFGVCFAASKTQEMQWTVKTGDIQKQRVGVTIKWNACEHNFNQSLEPQPSPYPHLSRRLRG